MTIECSGSDFSMRLRGRHCADGRERDKERKGRERVIVSERDILFYIKPSCHIQDMYVTSWWLRTNV